MVKNEQCKFSCNSSIVMTVAKYDTCWLMLTVGLGRSSRRRNSPIHWSEETRSQRASLQDLQVLSIQALMLKALRF